MKQYFFACILLLCSFVSKADTDLSFTVGGDMDKYYPVSFFDGNWQTHRATRLEIGRSNIHENADWRGSLISTFEYHCSNWGSGSQFVNAQVNMLSGTVIDNFIAGWSDVSTTNSSSTIIIWLRGGGTTYHYSANADVTPLVYDGVQNALPYHQENGPDFSYKTAVDDYVSQHGSSLIGNTIITGRGYTGTYAMDIIGGNYQHLRLRGGTPIIKFAGATYNNGNGAEIAQEGDGRFFINVNSGLNVFSASANGNVGIGAPYPLDKLQVAGSAKFSVLPDGNGAYTRISWNAIPGTGASTFDNHRDLGNVGFIFRTTNDNNTFTELMRMSANGNIGIGTTNPTEKLSVDGTIKTRKVVVTQTGWADYVFAPSYKLPSLDSVAAFIETNKHLPGIPSEAEVKKDGHDVGEMQKLLLQKVEELTLYMLQFKKDNEELKEKYELLKKENSELRKNIQASNPKQ